MIKPTLWVTKGLPGAGKTTWAHKFVEEHPKAIRVCREDIRNMCYNGNKPEYDPEKDTWIGKNRNRVLQTEHLIVRHWLGKGYDVVLDGQNLTPRHEKRIQKNFGDIANIKWKDFTVIPVHTCMERDSYRVKPVGRRKIKYQYETYIKGKP